MFGKAHFTIESGFWNVHKYGVHALRVRVDRNISFSKNFSIQNGQDLFIPEHIAFRIFHRGRLSVYASFHREGGGTQGG